MTNLPPEFLNRLKNQLGGEFDDFLKSFDELPPVSVRVNPFKSTAKFDAFEKVPWATDAYYLPERISFTLDPLFHAGCYYVQEASSMYVEAALKSVIDNGKPQKVLDLCAAPGGKSTHLLSFLPEGSVVVSNEVIPSRNKILQQNITKWGCANAVVTQNDPADFKRLPAYFDVIVVDAPCSGEGLFRKDAKATEEWNTQAVDRCAARQSTILADVIDCLKENGILVYSTCTFETSENDDQIDRLVNEFHFEKITLPLFQGIQSSKNGVQFYPHRIKGEGFYLAILRKKTSRGGNINYGKPEFPSKYQKTASPWLQYPDDFLVYAKETDLYAIPTFMKQDFTLLMKNLYIRQAGVHLGELMKNELVPAHQLSQFTGLNKSMLRADLNAEQAISYLRCEAVNLPGLQRGWYVATYEGLALGWIKALGNRINNYYPKELRILMKS